MIACSACAAVPISEHGVVSIAAAPAIASAGPAGSTSSVAAPVPDQAVSAMPSSAKRSHGKSPTKQRSDTGARKKAVSKINSRKRKHEPTAEGADGGVFGESKEASQPRPAATANTRSISAKLKLKNAKPATLMRGDVEHKHAASLQKHCLGGPRENRRCRWPQGCSKHQSRGLSFPGFRNLYCSGHFYEFARRAGPTHYNHLRQNAKEKRRIAREKRRRRAEAAAAAAC